MGSSSGMTREEITDILDFVSLVLIVWRLVVVSLLKPSIRYQ